MDLINYLLQHLSVDKLVTAMKDRGFVLAGTNLQTHFPHPPAHLHLPSSTTHHVTSPTTPVQTLLPQTAPASTQLQQGRERDQTPRQRGAEREREREKGRERESETDGCSKHTLTGKGRADHPGACRADQCSTSASAQPSHRSSLTPPLPYYKGQGREEEDQGYAVPMEEIGQPLYNCLSCRAAAAV
jgi:hypothetical protein